MNVVGPGLRHRRTSWGGPATLASALVALVGLGCALGLGARAVLPAPIDRPVLRFVADNRSGWLTSMAAALTTFGAPALLLALAIGLGCAWWTFRGTSVPLVLLLTAWLGAEILFNVVKVLVDRPRPPVAMAVHHFGGLAFPSGHATQAAAVWGMVAALACLSVSNGRGRRAVVGVALATAIVVGVTRVYLGAHWVSDVLGGWLLGTLWMLVVLRTVARSAQASNW